MKIKALMSIALFVFTVYSMHGQISINVGIGTAPAWGPPGYAEEEYYYLPDVESYYDIRNQQFIYLSGGHWIRSRNLSRRYRNYDLYAGRKVVINDYHGARPYDHFNNHKVKYFKAQEFHGEREGRREGPGQERKGRPNEGRGNNGGERNHEDKENRGNGHGKGKE